MERELERCLEFSWETNIDGLRWLKEMRAFGGEAKTKRNSEAVKKVKAKASRKKEVRWTPCVGFSVKH